jgi:hypothetical protein
MILYLAILAVLVAVAGLFKQSWLALLVAGLMATPLALYLSMTPRFRGFGLLLALPPFVAAPFVRTRRGVAGALVAVFAVGFIATELMIFGAF